MLETRGSVGETGGVVGRVVVDCMQEVVETEAQVDSVSERGLNGGEFAVGLDGLLDRCERELRSEKDELKFVAGSGSDGNLRMELPRRIFGVDLRSRSRDDDLGDIESRWPGIEGSSLLCDSARTGERWRSSGSFGITGTCEASGVIGVVGVFVGGSRPVRLDGDGERVDSVTIMLSAGRLGRRGDSGKIGSGEVWP